MSMKICLIPIYGPIAFFIYISKCLKKNNAFNAIVESGYLFAMGFLGLIGMLLSGVTLNLLSVDSFEVFIGLGLFYIWVLITLPVIAYSKKLENSGIK